ncbi:Proteasome activator complex subunit 3 [Trichinella zimbabwensis]|uniref:Proteasome activator complex subunit 3 n=1 Tax=Trichinella zimbabwensis TaxID=268475 RepID=A0A0V1H397_9BILA|nr:Proteasome activator complex subunit 3 [Trichinella zimbabwensis]
MSEDDEEVALGGLEVWKQELNCKAEALVLEVFPRKGREMDDLMKSQFGMDRLPEIMAGSVNSDTLRQRSNLTSYCSTSAEKVGDSDNRDEISILCNKKLVEMNDLAMQLLHEMCENAGLLKKWLGFLIPRMEGGNNFGVSVQLKTLNEVCSVRKSTAVALQLLSRYYVMRAESIKKLLKHPGIEDYIFLIQSIDRRHFITIRIIVMALRNNYFGLNDHFLKNLELIRNPRSDNTQYLY